MGNIAHWLEADELPKCQHCEAAADERSFMCEDHAGEADEEVDTLREQLRGAVQALEAIRDAETAIDEDGVALIPDHRAMAREALARLGGQ